MGWNKIAKATGTSSQYIKGDGSFDSSTYALGSSAQNGIISYDSRLVNDAPNSRNKGLYVDFKQQNTIGLTASGTYAGVLTFRSYGSGTDLSGGPPIQIAYADNGQLYTRYGSSGTAWNSWNKIVLGSGTSSQFIKGDGSLDSTTYSASTHTHSYLPLSGGTLTGNLTTNGQIYSSSSTLQIRGAGNTPIIYGVSGATYLYAGNSTTTALTLQAGHAIAGSGFAYGGVNNYTKIIDGATGALTGTSATFSGHIYLDNNMALYSDNSAGTPQKLLRVSTGDDVTLGNTSLDDLIFDVGGKPSALKLTQSTGNATFAGTVQVEDQLTINRTGTAANNWDMFISHYGSGDYGSLFFDSNASTGNFYIRDSSDNVDFTVTGAGKVGIGTATPAYKLDVQSSTANDRVVRSLNSATSGTNYAGQFWAGGVGATKNIGIHSTAEGATTNVAGIFIGDVGIGTTSPSAKLHVNATQGWQSLFSDGADGLLITTASGVASLVGYDGSAYNDVSLRATSGTQLYLDTGGNVGIGTTSPSAPLSLLNASLTTNGTGEGGLRVHRPNAASQYGYFDYGYNGGGVNIGSFYSGSGASVFGTFTFRQHSSTTSQIPMFINNTGNVGIGTTAPATGLHLQFVDSKAQIRLDNTGTGGRDWSIYSSYDSNSIGGGKFAFADNTAGSTRMVIDSSGNVGIGTSSPDRLLTLQGDNSYMWLKDAGGGNVAFIGGDGANDGFLRLYNGSHAAKAEIQSDGVSYFTGGNVGIGTTSPSSPLHVVGTGTTDGATTGLFTATGNSSGTAYGIQAISTGASTWDNRAIYSSASGATNGNFSFYGSAGVLYNAGNVGIGTTTPSDELQIRGATPYINLKSNSDNVAMGLALQENSGAYMGYFDYSGSAMRILANHSRDIQFVTSNGTVHIEGSNGNVGIGTTSPKVKLQVNDSGTSPSNSGYGTGFNVSRADGLIGMTMGFTSANNSTYIQGRNFTNTDTQPIAINPLGGNVGIGTASPVGKLHVLGSSYNHLELESAGGNVGITFDVETSNTNYYDWRIDAQGTVANGLCIGHSTAAGNQTFNAANMVMTMLSSGNVGIGTTSPDSILHLEKAGGATLRIANSSDGASDETHIGTIEFEGDDGSTNRAGVMAKIVSRYSDTGSGDSIDGSVNEGGSLGFYTSIATAVAGPQTLAEKMRIENNGNVGIGTTSPDYTLDVAGDIGVDEYIYRNGDGNTYIQFAADRVKIFAGGENAFDYDESSASTLNIANSGEADISLGGGNVFVGGSHGSYDAKVGIGTTAPEGKLHIFTADASIGPNADGDELVVENSGNAGISILSGNTSNGTIFFGDTQDNNVGIIDYDHNVNRMSFTTGATATPVTIDANQRIYASGGIQVGSSFGEILDSYEEGSWTPQFTNESLSSNTASATLNDCHYVKIGAQVTLWAKLANISKGNASGNFTIKNLPFTVEANHAAGNVMCNGFNFVGKLGNLCAYVKTDGTIKFYETGDGIGWDAVDWSEIDHTTDDCNFYVTYRTTQ